jgi:hypothetical protein
MHRRNAGHASNQRAAHLDRRFARFAEPGIVVGPAERLAASKITSLHCGHDRADYSCFANALNAMPCFPH